VNLQLRFKVIVLLFLAQISMFGQGEIGDGLFDNFEYNTAVSYYEKDEALSPNQKDNLAYCYYVTHQYDKASLLYGEILKDENADPIFNYFYGISLKNSGQYAEAKIWLDKALQQDTASYYVKNAIKSVALLPDLMGVELQKEIIPLPKINNGMAMYAPAWYKDGFLYCAELKNDTSKRRPTIEVSEGFEGVNDLVYGTAERPLSTVYYANLNADFEVTKVDLFAKNEKFHIGAFHYLASENELYFTKVDLTNKWDPDARKHPRLYKGKVEGKEVVSSERISIKKLSIDDGAGHPSLSNDGKTIYFSSNRKGGYGGSDLYKVTALENGKWSEPINLGAKINTEGDELYPNITAENVLYFATDGRPGFGGLDIYKATQNNTEFAKPKLLAQPINSVGDDYGLILHPSDTSRGLFTSNRFGGAGDDDIYMFKLLKPDLLVQGRTLDGEGNPLANVSIRLYNEEGVEVAKAMSDADGNYEIEALEQGSYSIVASYPGKGVSEEVVLNDSWNSATAKDLYLTPMATAQGVVLLPDGSPAGNTKIELKDAEGNLIYSAITDENGRYDFILEDDKTYQVSAENGDLKGSKVFVTDENYNSLNDKDIYLKKAETYAEGTVYNEDGTPAVGVLVELFDEDGNLIASTLTDAEGNYHFDLERDKNYQIVTQTDTHQGVINLFTGDNYDETKRFNIQLEPIGKNTFAVVKDKKTDTPIGGVKVTAINNKTNIKITDITDADGKFNLNLTEGDEYTLNLEKEGYYPKSMDVTITEGGLSDLDLTLENDMGMDYAGYDVDKIYFEYKKSKLTEGATHQLDKVVATLKEHPKAIILIKSYADCRGGNTYNVSLSWKRSRTVKRYLIDNGIKSGRILTKSLGATNFVNNCITPEMCTESEHSLNRRSEFEIDFREE